MASEPERLGGGDFGRGPATMGVDWGSLLRQRPSLLVDTLIGLSVLFAATTAASLLLSFRLSLGWAFVASVLLSLALIFALVIHALPSHPHQRFGPANLVTAFRACLVSLTGATVLWFDGLATSNAVLWVMSGVVLVALALDGVDGYLARTYGHESALGARFDMEVDALLILILSLAVVLLEKAGLWVLLIGVMRYGFVVAGWLTPRLNGELFPSVRRKLVCVVQISALCVILVPFVTPPLSTVIAAAALLALVYSFTVDVLYLLRQPVSS